MERGGAIVYLDVAIDHTIRYLMNGIIYHLPDFDITRKPQRDSHPTRYSLLPFFPRIIYPRS